MLVKTLLILSLLASVELASAKSERGLLAVIRDKVTPEETSEIILNPRKRELIGFPSYQPDASTQTIPAEPDQANEKSKKFQRDLRAVQMITTRLVKPAENVDYGPDEYVRQHRLKRIVYTSTNKKPKPLPVAFLTAVARVVVPARPETRSAATSSLAESTSTLFRVNEAKRATI